MATRCGFLGVDASNSVATDTADYSEDDGLRRYFFDGFDVLIREETVEEMRA